MARLCKDCGVELSIELPPEFTHCEACYKKAISDLVPNLRAQSDEI